jgi:Ca2+-dependent lipid-binding protein
MTDTHYMQVMTVCLILTVASLTIFGLTGFLVLAVIITICVIRYRTPVIRVPDDCRTLTESEEK